MSIFPLIIAICASLLIGYLANARWRSWCLLITSLLAIYWLQPGIPIHHLDFWLPTACLVITILTWVLTRPKSLTGSSKDIITGFVISALIVVIGLPRYLGSACCLTASRPPAFLQIVGVIVTVSLLVVLILRFLGGRAWWMYGFSFLIIIMFIILKSASLAKLASTVLRSMSSQSMDLASPLDIKWLGFSYVAFRLLHTIHDRLSGRLPDLTLQEFVIYIIFFPAYSAGPIDRVQRFTQDLHQPYHLNLETAFLGGKRILIGMFSKFVIADGLALFALSSTNSDQVRSTGWLWIMLYAFALRIFFDFAGYTDIAIGMGQFVGIHLPENFERPYLKQNLTLFWNSWHMTLAQWFRAYFFNPLTRTLRASPRNIPMPLIIFIGQLSTFLLIGLWHGISWNFAIWGAWQGIGLFVHNRWSDWIRPRGSGLGNSSALQRLASAGSTLLTFNYVNLGWVWFALSTPAQSWNTLLKLFGMG